MDTSKVREWMWLDAEAVVAHALRDLRAGKAISIPTRRYQAMSLVGRLAPRGVVARIARIGR
jgi:hypothetical protein